MIFNAGHFSQKSFNFPIKYGKINFFAQYLYFRYKDNILNIRKLKDLDAQGKEKKATEIAQIIHGNNRMKY